MRYHNVGWIIAIALILVCGMAQGAERFRLEDHVVEYALDNGMTFLIMRRGEAPVFSGNITFRVGGVDEWPGVTGLAHLYEHMAFKGTHKIGVTDYRKERRVLAAIDAVAVPLSEEIAKGDKADPEKIAALRKQLKPLQEKGRGFVVKDELWDTYLRHGGTGLNASTSKDRTQYYVSLPANRLELWAWLESDRLLNPVLREFYSERDVVAEEHRLGIETRADGTLYRDFIATAFLAHPARYSVVGWMSDIRTVTRREAEAFGRRFYAPGNAAAALVGDLDVEETKRIVKRYFGRLPKRPLPPPITTREPEQRGERRVKVEWDHEPELIIGYHKPDPLHDDEAVFDVIDAILSRGRTARFYKTIVRDRRLATSVGTWTGPTNRYPNLFTISATPLHPHTTAELEQAIYEVLGTLVTDPPSAEELQKVRNNLHADFLRRMRSNRGLAGQLSYYEAIFGDWRYIETHLGKIDAVTADDVVRVAKKYFVSTNRTVGEIVNSAQPEKEG